VHWEENCGISWSDSWCWFISEDILGFKTEEIFREVEVLFVFSLWNFCHKCILYDVILEDINKRKYFMAKNKKITVQGTEITITSGQNEDYISLTDMARYKNAANTDDIIKNWLRNRNTIELLGFWETIYNPDFKPVEFDGFRKYSR
jgi:hypothetical protein